MEKKVNKKLVVIVNLIRNVMDYFRKKVELKKKSSKYILKSTLTPSLARKQLERSSSMNTLHKSHSCSSLDGNLKTSEHATHGYNNYLTVHVSNEDIDK